ncbi:MAG: phosphatase PAP2 family protein [Flavobacteriales bacterium]|nr:phosphatase PAP2 family protein [Flavobacteriales bacterium]
MIETLESLDIALFLFLNGLYHLSIDPLMLWISDKYVWIPFYIFLLALVVRKHELKSLLIIVPALIILITLSDQISVHVFKNGFERLRPCYNEDVQGIVHLVGNCGGQFGFISSHATNSFALAAFLTLVMKTRSFTYMIIAWAAIVSYSRIYLGVHYPADIIGGMVIGSVIGSVVWLATKHVNERLDYILSYE